MPKVQPTVQEGERMTSQPTDADVLDIVKFESAPCYRCGYKGTGYFQPDTHPCAAEFHRIQHLTEELRDPLIAAEKYIKLERERDQLSAVLDQFCGFVSAGCAEPETIGAYRVTLDAICTNARIARKGE